MTIPVIDAHHHIWRQADLPWLSGPILPRIFGPYESVRRDYPIKEYLADIAGTGVVKSVYVQANWAPARAEEEVAFVEQAAAETGWPHAIVGYANLLDDDVRPTLDRLKTYPLVRGIRMQLHWHTNEQYRFAKRPDLVDDATFRRNFSALADYGFSFDLQVFADQMVGAARLAADFPQTTFILQHAGMLEDLSDAGRAVWRQAIEGRADVRGHEIGIGDERVGKTGLVMGAGDIVGLLDRVGPVRLDIDGFLDAGAFQVGEEFGDGIVAADRLIGPEDARLHRSGEPGEGGLPPDVMMRVDDGHVAASPVLRECSGTSECVERRRPPPKTATRF